MDDQTSGREVFEKLLLILLFVITITQFSTWGFQSVRFILTSIFPVEDQVTTTPIEVIIGFGAMLASALVFAGAIMWWKQMDKAFTFITIGSLLFVAKNVLDMFHLTVVFGMTQTKITMNDIDALAGDLGQEFFQLAFWVFIFFFFRHHILKFVETKRQIGATMPSAQEPGAGTATLQQ